MAVKTVEKPAVSVLNYCAKHLARERGSSTEAWRFPIIEPYREGDGPVGDLNLVTFVYDGRAHPEQGVGVIGTFSTLYDPHPLVPVPFNGEDTGFRALTISVPVRESHVYKFVFDGDAVVDPINPQRVQLDDGSTWSRFFTDGCTQPVSFERWEYALLERLVSHILPFRTVGAQRFLDAYYYTQDRGARDRDLPTAFRLDDQVGVVNFIDNCIAREELHRRVDYKLCLSIIDRVLRQRNPFVPPGDMPRDMFVELYEQMARDDVPGWNTSLYARPSHFLRILRRHTLTGAFCHPRYGGNAGAAAWAFLAERYRDDQGRTLFDFRAALEPPLGTSDTYRG